MDSKETPVLRFTNFPEVIGRGGVSYSGLKLETKSDRSMVKAFKNINW